MHVNFGIIPPLEAPVRKKRERYAAYSERAQQAMEGYIAQRPDIFGAA